MSSYQRIAGTIGGTGPTYDGSGNATFPANASAAVLTGTAQNPTPAVVAGPGGSGQVQVGANTGGGGVVIQNNGVATAYLVTGNQAAYASWVAAGYKNSTGAGLVASATVPANFNLVGVNANVINQTTSGTITASTSGATYYANSGSLVTITLPTAVQGLSYTMINGAGLAAGIKAQAAGTDKFASSGAIGASAGSLTATTIYSSISFTCYTSGIWQVTTQNGTWTLA